MREARVAHSQASQHHFLVTLRKEGGTPVANIRFDALKLGRS
jgi:hypothetical protein